MSMYRDKSVLLSVYMYLYNIGSVSLLRDIRTKHGMFQHELQAA